MESVSHPRFPAFLPSMINVLPDIRQVCSNTILILSRPQLVNCRVRQMDSRRKGPQEVCVVDGLLKELEQ